MLRIIQSTSVSQAKGYYSKADYYSEGQELAGTWGGIAADRLGLHGEIRQQDFERLCDNLHPATGERLSPRTKTNRTVGYDFNFHVPKAISVAYMLTQDERILDAFRVSVRETMQELEADAKTRVRGKGRDEERVSGNLAWGEFIHLTARPVDGVPDPHLHAHCFVQNLTFDSEEQRWKAVQFRDIKRDAPYYEAAFYARFAKRLTDLGYPIARTGKQWDLAGVPKSLAKKFSRRTQQVEEHAEERGIRNAREKDTLGAKTRERKAKQLSMPELRNLWQGRLSTQEHDALAQLGVAKPHASTPESPSIAMQHAIGHCFERSSVVASREVLAESLRLGLGAITPETAQAALKEAGVIVRNYRGRAMATTPQVLKEEQEMLDYARSGRGICNSLSPGWRIKNNDLNDGQRTAVRHVTESRDRVMLIKGSAGTGKTKLMTEAVEAIEANGRKVFTFAPSSEASRNVLRSEGFINATTVAELLINQNIQKEASGEVLWIDEAGLLGTRQLKQLFDLAGAINARVILSGDWRQHGAVERGAAMRLLEQEGGLRPAVVSTIKRQTGRYMDAVAALSTGDTEEGLKILDELGWIKEVNDGTLAQRVAREYAETLVKDGIAPLVVSPTHAEGNRITEAIRVELRAHKLLGGEKEFWRLMPLNFTTAERADKAMYEAGDVIVFQQNAAGHKKGERITVKDVPPEELLALAPRFQVYKREAMSLFTGDRIRFTSNGYDKSGKHRLNNGAVHRIRRFAINGDVVLDNGWVVEKEHGFMAPGYVVTSHSAQGRTVDKVIIAESSESLAAASQEQFYVSVSRGRYQAKLFTDNRAALRDAIARANSRMAAVELVSHVAELDAIRKRSAEMSRKAAERARQATAQVKELTHERG
jgi:conjugative relaxase-like TrwC/TraI family protein